MSVANRFTGVPAVPQGGFTDYQTVLIGAVKENVDPIKVRDVKAADDTVIDGSDKLEKA